MAELKPCPFCGGEAKYMNITEGIFISRFVTCTKCGIETKRNYFRRGEAIKAWNTRKPMEAVVAELNETGRKFCENVGCSKECENCEHGALMRTIIEIVRGKE